MGLDICPVCSKLISSRFGGVCPGCRPAFRTRDTPIDGGREIPRGYPSLEDVHKLGVNTRKHVPVGARAMWGECLAKAAHEVTEHNDVLAWTEWSMLAKVVMGAPRGRGGAAHRKRVEADVKARCR